MQLRESNPASLRHILSRRNHLKGTFLVFVCWNLFICVHLCWVEAQKDCVQHIRVHLHHQSLDKIEVTTILFITKAVSGLGWASSCFTWYSDREKGFHNYEVVGGKSNMCTHRAR